MKEKAMKLYGWTKVDEYEYSVQILDIDRYKGELSFDKYGELRGYMTAHPGKGRWFRSYSAAKCELLKIVRYKASLWRKIVQETLQARKEGVPS